MIARLVPSVGSVLIVFVELKSRRGAASKAQKKARAEILPSGALWVLARSARAAMVGLQRASVRFRRTWEPPPLELWERPFTDPNHRLPEEPSARAECRAAQRRCRGQFTQALGADDARPGRSSCWQVIEDARLETTKAPATPNTPPLRRTSIWIKKVSAQWSCTTVIPVFRQPCGASPTP
jgi:hypothetical protein